MLGLFLKIYNRTVLSIVEFTGHSDQDTTIVIREFPWVPCVQWESPGNGNRWASFTGMGMGMGTA